MLLTPLALHPVRKDREAPVRGDRGPARGRNRGSPADHHRRGRAVRSGGEPDGDIVGVQDHVIDNDMATIQLLRRFGFKGYIGDPTRPDLLKAAGLDQAKILVAALDDKDATTRLVAYARRERDDLHIVARAYDRQHVFELYRAGADDIVREMFDSSLRAARYVLENVGLSKTEAFELERLFFDLDRKSVSELARVWKPGVPIEKNAEYMALARTLNRDLETALMTRSSAVPDMPGPAQQAAAANGKAKATTATT